MIKAKHWINAAAIALFVLFIAACVWAEDTDTISGSDLLKSIRGKETKPAYEDLPDKPASAKVAEPNTGEIESKPAPKPQKPPVKQVTSEPAAKPKTTAVSKPAAKTPGDELLSMIPAECLFCVRVNNFDYTINQMDQFLAGVSPMPMGLSMLVRMQLVQMLGSPMLNGINMGGNFAIFGLAMPSQSTEAQAMPEIFIAGLIPVTDYQQFIRSNPNIGPPDEKGVSKITGQDLPEVLVMRAGNYAVISPVADYDKLAALAKLILSRSAGLTNALNADQSKMAMKEPLWGYGNIQLATKSLGDLEQMTTQWNAEGQAEPAAITTADLVNLQKNIKSVSLAINPKPDVCRLALNIISDNTTAIRGLIEKAEMKTVKQIDNEQLKEILAVLPQAMQADFAGRYNLMDLLKTATAMVPAAGQMNATMAAIDIPAESGAAFAIKFDYGKTTLDIAVPKKHLAEIMAAVQEMPKQTFQLQQAAQPQETVKPQIQAETAMVEQPAAETTLPDIPEEQVETLQKPVQGRIRGTQVTLENASLENDNFALYTGEGWGFNPSVLVFLLIKDGTILDNQSFSVALAEDKQPDTPNIHYRWRNPETGKIESEMVTQGYRLILKFGQEKGGKISGEILLEIPEKDTRIEGHFNAEIKGTMWKKATSNNTGNPANQDSTVASEEAKTAAESPSSNELVAKQLQDGYQKERSKDFDGAIEAYQQITQNTEAPERYRAQAHYQMGMCYLKKDDKNKAAEQFRLLVSDFPRRLTPVAKAIKELRRLDAEMDDNNV